MAEKPTAVLKESPVAVKLFSASRPTATFLLPEMFSYPAFMPRNVLNPPPTFWFPELTP